MTRSAPPRAVLPVYLEVGAKRTFACALDWPGWARSGRTEQAALDALTDYAPRYLPVARRTGLPIDFEGAALELEVVERVPGTPTTDFGAPDVVLERDLRPVSAADAERLTACLEAAWAELDVIASRTSPRLARGPRGGGRDRDAMLEHVIAAEQSYARKIGVAHRVPAAGDTLAIGAMRADIVAVLRQRWDGTPLHIGRGKSWPPRYAARRFAWHVLDHAWEVEDRS